MGRLLTDSVCSKKHTLKVHNDRYSVSYQLFRRWIIQRSRSGAPAASTPLATGRHRNTSFMLDTVRQRLLLDSPPRHHPETAQVETQIGAKGFNTGAAQLGGTSHPDTPAVTPGTTSIQRSHHRQKAAEPMMFWKAVGQELEKATQPGSANDLQPFRVLSTESVSPQGQSQMKLAAPALLNDYYTHLLDCSCNGMIAVALGSSVFLWSSQSRALVGCLAPKLQPGRAYTHGQTILSLCWSSDGRALCIGNRRGDVELWDVEHILNMRCLQLHQAAVRALSWKQNLLSSGSDLGHIHHYDPRAPMALAGAAIQQGGVCSLQWSQDDQLASGSMEGFLHVWDSGITRKGHLHQPVTTVKQPTSVKAMGWCPWQKNTIATGGGWKDGELRIWDTQSGACVTSVKTNSQICCLHWAEKKRLVTGHGVPYQHISSWTWDRPALSLSCQLSGHSKRVLHLALNPDGSQIFSAGADQVFQIWDMSL